MEVQAINEAIDRLTFGSGVLGRSASAPASAPPPFDRIVAATDAGPASSDVAAWAREMARIHQAEVWAAHVQRPGVAASAPDDPGLTEAGHRRGGWEMTQALAEAVGGSATQVNVAVESGFPVRALVGLVEDVQASLVIVGSHRPGPLSRLLLGSVADGVKSQARASVLVARSPAPPGTLLLAVDGSVPSKRAALVALRLAKAWRVPLVVVHAVDRPLSPEPSADLEGIRGTFEGVQAPRWSDSDVTFEVRVGRPAAVIAEAALGLDHPLVVVGCRGLGGLRSLVPGSVSGRVAHTVRSSVLIVK